MGAERRRSPGRGASRGGGSSGRRGREGGRAPRSPARPAPTRGPYPLCRVCGRYRAEAGAACAPREHPVYIYQRVVSPEPPADPSPITQSGQSEGRIRHLVPPPPLPGFQPPALRPSGRLEPPNTGPIEAIRGFRGPIRTGMRARESPGCSRGAQGAPHRHHPAYSPRSERGSGFGGGRPRRPGDAGTAIPPHKRPHPGDRPRHAPTCAVAARLDLRSARRRARPTGRSPSRLRCPLEPSLRETPSPGDHLRHAPTCAVAAGLNLDSVRRRARVRRPPRPHLCHRRRPEPSPRGAPHPTDRPARPTAAVAARPTPGPVRSLRVLQWWKPIRSAPLRAPEDSSSSDRRMSSASRAALSALTPCRISTRWTTVRSRSGGSG